MSASENMQNPAGDPLFSQLVMMLSSSALQHMGQAPGPDGSPPNVDLHGAEFMIDLLEMIERKTAGNLDAREKRMLTEVLAAVRMAFVQAAGAPGEHPEEPPQAPSAAAAAEAALVVNTKGADPAPKDKGEEPRFHKSYG